MPKLKKIANEIKKTAKKKLKKKKKVKKKGLSSGSTLLNLACTNNPFRAFLPGKYYYLVGDSTSGKTFISMSCFAEAVQSDYFKDYKLILDNAEDGMLINLEKLFNKKIAQKVESPSIDEQGNPIHSFSIEEFYYHLDDVLKKKKPFIYVLDSMDSLSSASEVEKFEEHKKAHRKGTKTAGSYGDGKAKKNSEGLRKILKGLRETRSILIIISQTRDNLGFGFEKKSRAGGHALRFYAAIELWSNIIGAIKKTVRGKKRQVGVHIGIKIKKNRVIGELNEAQLDIYPSYGIDDLGSIIDYLLNEKWWAKKGLKINAKEFDVILNREKLIQYIEENNLQRKLQIITGQCWKEIRTACNLNRKKRYGK